LANNGEILTQAAVDGLGVALQPTFIAYEHLAGKRLQRVLSDYETTSVNLYVVFPPGRYTSRRVRALADYLSDYFGEQPYWDAPVEQTAKANVE
jgi:DNA-binding transcriptional LysR family regulator